VVRLVGGEENHGKVGGQVSWCSETQTSHLPNKSEMLQVQSTSYLLGDMYRGFRDGQNSSQ
jgi:hypothetical protein